MTGVVTDLNVCLERVLTTRLVEPHLGQPGVALDLGGGTGPYAVWLTELGWDVRAWPGGLRFDAVVGLEPFRHPTADDVRALARITRPGGLVALAIPPLPAFAAPGFDTVTVVAAKTLLADDLEAVRLVDPSAYRVRLDRLVAGADDPLVLATAPHLLWVGRRAYR